MAVNKSSEAYRRRAKNYNAKVMRRFRDKLEAVPVRAVEALAEGLMDIAELSFQYTPLDKGPLRNSLYVDIQYKNRKYTGVVGYATEDVKLGNIKQNSDFAPYAVFVHEIPRSNYTTAGTGHLFLTRAFDEKKDEVLKRIEEATATKRKSK